MTALDLDELKRLHASLRTAELLGGEKVVSALLARIAELEAAAVKVDREYSDDTDLYCTLAAHAERQRARIAELEARIDALEDTMNPQDVSDVDNRLRSET